MIINVKYIIISLCKLVNYTNVCYPQQKKNRCDYGLPCWSFASLQTAHDSCWKPVVNQENIVVSK